MLVGGPPAAPARVLRTCPIDGDSDLLPAAPIHIVFDQPMDTDPAALSITITPELPFRIEWLAPERLLLYTEPRLSGELYQLSLAEARSRQGTPLAEPLSLTFGQGGRGAPIPILMYHHVHVLEQQVSSFARSLTVSPQDLAAHLELFAALGANIVPLGEAVDYLRGGEPLPARPVVLTFDDGYETAYLHVAPILQERGATATFFIVPAYVGHSPYMGWDQLAALTTAGHTIGGHGYDHSRVDFLGEAQAEQQFGASRWSLEERLGVPVTLFAYPYGNYCSRAISQVAQYGYHGAVSVEPTVYQRPDRIYALGRISIGYGEPAEVLRRRLPW
jgi:peptidoglycan/xylan/chitin deacetylase (PgdA/CDA1 family)